METGSSHAPQWQHLGTRRPQDNWVSTWANNVSGYGSFGQNGGSLREVALTAGGAEASSGLDITSGSPMWVVQIIDTEQSLSTWTS